MKIFFYCLQSGDLEKKKPERNGYNSETRNIEYDIINFICFSAVAHYKIDVPTEKKCSL